MVHKIIKHLWVSVKAAFHRIEVLTKLLELFPLPSSCGKTATSEQWEDFQAVKKLSSIIKREMKYNLLPESFHDQFDNLEFDYTEMSISKFLSEAQKCKTTDAKEHLK